MGEHFNGKSNLRLEDAEDRKANEFSVRGSRGARVVVAWRLRVVPANPVNPSRYPCGNGKR
jgi:hypothetical protein